MARKCWATMQTKPTPWTMMLQCLNTQIPVAASLINKNEQEAFVKSFSNHSFNSWHHRRQIAIWAALETDGSKISCTVLGEGVHFFACFLKKNVFIAIHYFFISTHPELSWDLRLFFVGSLYICDSILMKINIYIEWIIWHIKRRVFKEQWGIQKPLKMCNFNPYAFF